MFLIRSAFWLFLLVMILPSEPAEQARLYQTASHALHQAATFCDRNAAICAEAEAQWVIFRRKLAVGTQMASDLVSERMAASSPKKLPADIGEPAIAPIDTLGPADRVTPWGRRARTQL